jgi:hypothetical protein
MLITPFSFTLTIMILATFGNRTMMEKEKKMHGFCSNKTKIQHDQYDFFLVFSPPLHIIGLVCQESKKKKKKLNFCCNNET